MVVVVVVHVVGAVAMMWASTGLLRGLGFPDCHNSLQWSEEARAFSQVFWMDEGVAVVATELLEILASAFFAVTECLHELMEFCHVSLLF